MVVIAANGTNADTGAMPHPTRTVACLIYPDAMSLDAVGPLQVFGSANAECAGHGLPPAYALRLLAEAAGPVTTSAGFALLADGSWKALDPAGLDTVLVAGGDGVIAQLGNTALRQWLRRSEPQVRRLGSVCSGALLLAQAGLLDGLHATTHWCRTGQMRRDYPAVQVDDDCLHTYDAASPVYGHIFTSAGVTAGIDLALALVEADDAERVKRRTSMGEPYRTLLGHLRHEFFVVRVTELVVLNIVEKSIIWNLSVFICPIFHWRAERGDVLEYRRRALRYSWFGHRVKWHHILKFRLRGL